MEQAVRTLSAARNLILDGRLRYHRQLLEMPISVSCANKRLEAQLTNLSQGGLRIHLDPPLKIRGLARVSFGLPGTKCTVKAEGVIVWRDQLGNAGIRFVQMSKRIQRELQLWLAQQYFTR